MKTTIDLPDDLLIQAKIHAARKRKSLKELIIAGLRHQLEEENSSGKNMRGQIRWVTVEGGLPKGADLANRESLADILSRSE